MTFKVPLFGEVGSGTDLSAASLVVEGGVFGI